MISNLTSKKIHLLEYLVVIQARLSSTRLPNKVMQVVGDRTILRRVWDAATRFRDYYNAGVECNDVKVIVAWPERYPDLDENNVLERFRRISNEFPSKYIIRLTSDCPLLEDSDIWKTYKQYFGQPYHSNHLDGHDVQIFTSDYLWDNLRTSREHVIADFSTSPTGLSVNTKEDLERVRQICKTKQS